MSARRALGWLVSAGVLVGVMREATGGGQPGVFSAEVEEPVVPELMGGCSLRCGFPWRVFELGDGFFDVSRVTELNDERPDTAWTAPADPIGTRLVIKFPDRLPPGMEGTPFYGFDIINGDWAGGGDGNDFARLKRAAVSHNGRRVGEFRFADSRRWQRILFPDIYLRSGDHLLVEVLEVYPAAGPLRVSEIVLQGAH